MYARRSIGMTHRRGVWRIAAMEVVSGVGDGVFWVGLIAVLLDMGVGVEGFALAALVRLGPRAIISAPAGVLADRVDRRRLLLALDLGRAAVMLGLVLVSRSDGGLVVLLVGVLVSYTLAAPYRPALSAALPLVAGERRLSSATALIGTIRQLMTFVGPVVGALVVYRTSPAVAFAVNAATFVLSALLVASVSDLGGKPCQTNVALGDQRANWSRQIADGWREVNNTSGLQVLAVLVFVMYAVRGAELVLFALLAEQQFGLGASGVGVLTGAVGLGALFALPIAARVADSTRPDVVLMLSLASTAIPTALLGVVHSTTPACIALFIVGFGIVTFEVVSVVLLQRLARPEMLGRVFGLIGTASNAGKLLGAVITPVMVIAFGLSHSLILLGGLVGIVGTFAGRGVANLARETRAGAEQLRTVVRTLSTLGVFDGASPFALEQLAAAARVEHFATGSVVLTQGDPADDMFVIRAGDFLVKADGRKINTLHAGDWFGEIGLLQRRARTASIVALTDAVVWRIPGTTFLSALEDTATEMTAMMDVMADRLTRLAANPA